MDQQTPPEVGSFTNKLCIRTFLDMHNKPSWVPVIGPQHDDRQFLKANFQHYHIDWRYLTLGQVKAIQECSKYSGTTVNQIVITQVIPEGYNTVINLNNIDQYPAETYLKDMKRRCSRDFTPYPAVRGNWLPDMEDAFHGQELIDGHTCPHQLTDLTTISPDSNGNVTCPLHGLTWNQKTGKLVKMCPLPSIVA